MDAAHHRLSASEPSAASDAAVEASSADQRTQNVSTDWRLWLTRFGSLAPVLLTQPGSKTSQILDRVAQQLFEGLACEALEKRRQRTALGIQVTQARANREALYLNPGSRERFEEMARSFLERALERMEAENSAPHAP
ncbi:unnamed protein product [Symbiodinium pilosum]|uniref:Uncharacterized protein n=1 Tax=Symbiodinium pilosum TaxID=2952 RepID=A0A812VWF0_SYMPI|nr:unnamed protein product [Symbiodinium pilosum]